MILKEINDETEWLLAYDNKEPAYTVINGNEYYNYYASELLSNCNEIKSSDINDYKIKKDKN